MPESKREVKTYNVDYICDECGKGKMKLEGSCLTSFPTQYPHICDNCGASMTFTKTYYPHVIYEKIDKPKMNQT